MKIGYLMLCNHDPKLVAKICKKVLIGTNNVVIVHVDKTANIELFKSEIHSNQVFFVADRVDIHWGGFSSIEATIKTMYMATNLGCERVVILQGRDYPIHSNLEIDSFFEKHRDVEFIRAFDVSHSPRKLSYMKVSGIHLFDKKGKSKTWNLIVKALNGFNKLGIKYCPSKVQTDHSDKRISVYWGWAHVALTRECVKYILDFYENNPHFNRRFRYIFPPDETYFQTIVFNSPFAVRTQDGGPVREQSHQTVRSMLNLTYFEYPSSVRVFNCADELDADVVTNYLFVRKVTLHFTTTLK